MLVISQRLQIPLQEIQFSAIRAQGSGGQNVNKVSSAVHLRFDIHASSLSCANKAQISQFPDARISSQGVIIIKSQTHRSQEKNRIDALARLKSLIQQATAQIKKRRPTRPTLGSKVRRIESKKKRAHIKSNRAKVDF